MNYLTFTQNFSQQEVILDSVSTPDELELTLSDDVSENSIVSSNNQRHEISNASSRKKSTFNKVKKGIKIVTQKKKIIKITLIKS